jgi:hypothetical protein
MARYEGMDELLNRVRQRLGVEPSSHPGRSAPQSTQEPAGHEQQYASMVERVLLLASDVEQLRDHLCAPEGDALTEEQRDELLGFVGKVKNDLESYERALHHLVVTRST